MSAPVLSVRDLEVRFGGLVACRLDSLDLERGQTLAAIGPNGAGKTTLLNALTGIVPAGPAASVRFDDGSGRMVELAHKRVHRITRIGLVRTFQNVGLFQDLTVLENLMIGLYGQQRAGLIASGLRLPRFSREEAESRARIEVELESAGLHEYLTAMAHSLPYPLQKRIDFVRALLMQPRVLLLDEPMAGMSRPDRIQMTELIKRARAERQLTLVLVEHDMDVVMSLADTMMVLNFGEVIARGEPTRVANDEQVVAAYIGATE